MDITYPLTFPYAGTDTAAGEGDLSLLVNSPSQPSASWSVLNGFLDGDNMTSTYDLEYRHTQRGSIAHGWSASGNANLDFRHQVFGGFVVDTGIYHYRAPALDDDAKVFIPGANKTFYLPVESHVLVTWTVTWNTHVSQEKLSKVYFHVDGTIQVGDSRNVGTTSDPSGAQMDSYKANFGYLKGRSYHGHYATEGATPMAAGWHTVGLGLVADPEVPVTRVHACDIVVLSFKA